MNLDQQNKHIISGKATVIQALEKLNSLSGGEMTLVVTDNAGKLIGTLTDGDVRRGLLSGHTTDAPVSAIMHSRFQAVTDADDDVLTISQLRAQGISLIPRIDNDGKIIDLIDTTATLNQLPLNAVLMAGGKGERLRPMTLATPKPLLEIQGKAIIDYNIDLLRLYGIENITVTVNYLAEQIEKHFLDTGVKVVREPRSLGTIGAVSLLEIPREGNTLVMNADLLTSVSLEDMYAKHIREKASVTIAAIPYNLSVPYAILDTDGSSVTAIEEKPSYSYMANAGIYIFSNDLLKSLTPNEKTDATDLIEQAIGRGEKVTFYPINGTWIDIGSPSDFNNAAQLMSHIQNMNRHPL